MRNEQKSSRGFLEMGFLSIPKWINKRCEEKRRKKFQKKVLKVEQSFDDIIEIMRGSYNGDDDGSLKTDGGEQNPVDRFIEFYRSYYQENKTQPIYSEMGEALGMSLDEVDEIYSIIKTQGRGK